MLSKMAAISALELRFAALYEELDSQSLLKSIPGIGQHLAPTILGVLHTAGRATALLDRLLHHAIVIQIAGSSYRLRRHADLLSEPVRPRAPEPKPRGRPPKNGGASQHN